MTTDGDGTTFTFLPVLAIGFVQLLLVFCIVINKCTEQGITHDVGSTSVSPQQDEQSQHHLPSSQQQSEQSPVHPLDGMHLPTLKFDYDQVNNELRPSLGCIKQSIKIQSNDCNSDNVRNNSSMDVEEGVVVQLVVDFGNCHVIPLYEPTCPICLSDYEHGDYIQRNAILLSRSVSTASSTIMYCDHMFHNKCIMQWLQTQRQDNKKCPICRKNFYCC